MPKAPHQNPSTPTKYITTKKVQTITGWPTDTLSIDCCHNNNHNNTTPPQKYFPHTIILFVPGNPGCVNWYEKTLLHILKKLNVNDNVGGYAARGVSYAGHGVGKEIVGDGSDDRDMSIALTIDGQVQHKIDWINTIIFPEIKKAALEYAISQARQQINQCAEKTNPKKKKDTTTSILLPPMPKFVFLSHSIGAHLIQRLLILRPPILHHHTKLILHLMPFFRFDPPEPHKTLLSTVARSPSAAVTFIQTMCKLAASLPREWIDVYLNKVVGVHDEEGRELAIDIAVQPEMARNHLVLGMEEIRDIPERHDDAGLRIIGKHSPTSILFAGGPDQWAPHFHIDDIQKLQRQGKLPNNIRTVYLDQIRHDYVVHPEMIQPVVDFCVDEMKLCDGLNDGDLGGRNDVKILSKL